MVCNTPGRTFPNRDEPSCSKVKRGFRGVRFIAEVQIDETRNQPGSPACASRAPRRRGKDATMSGFDPDVVSL